MEKVYVAWVQNTRVIDGDTVEVLLDLGYRVYHRVVIRLAGIDCPERNRKESRAAGLVATVAAARWIERKAIEGPLRIESYKLDKDCYGRCVGDILANYESLARWLLGEGLAKQSLEGGKRPEWTEGELTRIAQYRPPAEKVT